jgi:hypothetical protein
LKTAANNDKKITIVMADKKKLKDDKNREKTIKQLSEVKGIELLECHNLHAKCYYNDYRMVISSLNFHQISKMHNYEKGVTFTKKE